MAKNAVTDVGAPSYTSGAQKWNGAAVNLNKKPILNKHIPTCTNDGSVWEIPAKHYAKSSKVVIPVHPYTSEHPNKRIPDENAPSKKYFKPASVENSELRFDAANT